MSVWGTSLRAARRSGSFLRAQATPDAFRRFQATACRRLLAIAAGTEFYRQRWRAAGVPLDGVHTVEDLARLPPVSRDDWRAAPDDQLLTAPRERLVWHSTGGSAGAPYRVPYDPEDDVRLRASVLAVFRAHGARGWERALWMLPPDTHSKGGRRLGGRVRMVDSDATTDQRLAALAVGAEPNLRGYPWPLWRAAVRALRAGRTLPPRRLLVTGGEPLPDCARRTLEEVFRARVVNRYAATDYGQLAAECVAGRLHVCAGVHVDILRGDRPVAAGEEGEVVVTHFFSGARPVVRLRTGDVASWGGGAPCPCGNGLPWLEQVAGRERDILRSPGGGAWRFPAIERVLGGKARELLGFQCEQTGPDAVRARLSLRPGAAPWADAPARLAASMPGLRFTVDYTDEFFVEPNGKTRVCMGA